MMSREQSSFTVHPIAVGKVWSSFLQRSMVNVGGQELLSEKTGPVDTFRWKAGFHLSVWQEAWGAGGLSVEVLALFPEFVWL